MARYTANKNVNHTYFNTIRSRSIGVGIEIKLRDVRSGARIPETSVSTKTSRPGPIQPSIQWALGCEVDHSHKPSAEIKNEWSYTSTPPYTFTAWTGNT